MMGMIKRIGSISSNFILQIDSILANSAFSRPMQLPNAPDPIEVTELGILTEVRLSQR